MPEARTFRTRKPKTASETASRLPDVDRHPGTDAEQEQGHQGHDDRNQQGQMDCPSRAGTTRSAVLTGNNVVVTDG
jgi:hypothetical protein